MGASASCGACTEKTLPCGCGGGSDRALGYGEAERCAHFCGERRCRVECFVRRVVLWRRKPRSTPFQSLVCVEILPLGCTSQAQRTEAGLPETAMNYTTGSDRGKEAWVWDVAPPPAGCGTSASAASSGKLQFQASSSAQLVVRVLEVQGPWLLGPMQAKSDLLGETRLRLAEVTSEEILSSGAPGPPERCLLLILGSSICGQVELGVNMSYEDLLYELRSCIKEGGLCNGCANERLLPPLLPGPVPGQWVESQEYSLDRGRSKEFTPKVHVKAATILPPPEPPLDMQPTHGMLACGSRRMCVNNGRNGFGCLNCTSSRPGKREVESSDSGDSQGGPGGDMVTI